MSARRRGFVKLAMFLYASLATICLTPVHADDSEFVALYQGYDIAALNGGLGCQLRVVLDGDAVVGFRPTLGYNRLFQFTPDSAQVNVQNAIYELKLTNGWENLVVRYHLHDHFTKDAQPYEYEYHSDTKPSSRGYCKDLQYVSSGRQPRG